MSASLYLEHLTDLDLSFLAHIGEMGSTDDLRTYLRANPGFLEVLLQRETLFEALFRSGEGEAFLRGSPFLIFAVAVHRAAQDIQGLTFIEEWIGPGRRVPMFEVSGLRGFAGDQARRLFLIELLASYTRVTSGSYWTQTPRGWRRRRFSELDPFRLVERLESVPELERPALYRRLGDLSLFLTGVFPDHTGTRFFPPIARQRLRRVVPGADGPGKLDLHGASEPVWLLEELGRRSYRMAWQATQGMAGQRLDLLADVAEGFSDARRMLNFLTNRYLSPLRDHWFPLNGS